MNFLNEKFKEAENRLIDELFEKLPINNERASFKIWPRSVDADSLYHAEPSDFQINLKINRNPDSGDLIGYTEVHGVHSLSLQRPPGLPDENLLGSTSKLPFLPGGMESDWEEARKSLRDFAQEAKVDFDVFDLHSIPPGFANGIDYSIRFDNEIESKSIDESANQSKILPENVDIFEIMDFLSDSSGDFSFIKEPANQPEDQIQSKVISDRVVDENDLKVVELLDKPVSRSAVDLGQATKMKMEIKKDYKWAKWIDVNQPVRDFNQRLPVLAHSYPFELDTFQKQAVLHLESGDSVFVAAHTSAGKTVVAEYAIALCKQHLTRAIYTSPIKALSNQKFRDFKQVFDKVGLITGDIQLNPEAFCLIMTTEILRSMLLNGSEVVRELEWVIFDEVHYINDAERGVVWEEVLIFLPSHVKIIMLSATVSNTLDFAEWVGQIKQRNVYVISTPKRPVPLEHFVYTGKDGKSKDDRFLVVDQNGKFFKKGYDDALASKKNKKSTGPKGVQHSAGNPKTERNILVALIDHLSRKELLPAVAFTFSRRRCDENAANLSSIDLTTNEEKTEIHHFFTRCINCLQKTDRKLPQVLQMQTLCKQGLAVHHSGILPIMKEAVEMLFQKVRCRHVFDSFRVLFATETFAMGVNMPARTVIFDSTRKHDGKVFRDLEPHEYTQMAGRAGRRGLDKTGTVIILCKGDVPEQSDMHRMILGKPAHLDSQFRVTYSLLLNLLRVEQFRVEDVLKRSFAESSSLREASSRKEQLATIRQKLDDREILNCRHCVDGGLTEFYSTCKNYIKLARDLNKSLLLPRMTPGSYVTYSWKSWRNALGVLMSCSPSPTGKDAKIVSILTPKYENSDYFDENLNEDVLNLYDVAFADGHLAKPCLSDVDYIILTFGFDQILSLSTKNVKSQTLKILQEDVKRRESTKFKNSDRDENVSTIIREIQRLALANEKELSLFDPCTNKDLNLNDLSVLENANSLKNYKLKLKTFSCVHCLCFREHFEIMRKNDEWQTLYDQLAFQLSEESLQLTPAYKQKLLVLQELGYVDENKMVTLKGRVACHVNQYELLIAEMMLENLLSPLDPCDIAAVLSCITCQQKIDEKINLPEHLQNLRDRVENLAMKICDCQKTYRVSDYDLGELLRFDLMEVVYEWAKGTPFYQIMQLTTAQEGIIVRCIQRLNEVCRDVRSAARLVGDTTLQRKMEETSTLIKRDIVFAASLYTTM